MKKTFLFSALDGHGHVNSMIGFADWLKERGHNTVFLMSTQFPVPGHHVVSLESMMPDDGSPKVPGDEMFKSIFEKFSQAFTLDSRAINEFANSCVFDGMLESTARSAPIMEEYLEHNPPDVIICDYLHSMPALMNNKRKWVRIQSASGLGVWHRHFPDKVPPAFYGLPTQSPPHVIKECHEFDLRVRAKNIDFIHKLNAEYGVMLDAGEFLPESPYLNIYMYPKVLDYGRFCGQDLPPNWMRCDALVRSDTRSFQIPPSLLAKPGSLIFLSMGTLASMDLRIMKRLIEIFSTFPHKFIVAKGVRHEEYELADNMWGERFVPQLAVLKQVDLIITHGGNNTITECLYYGVPGMIILPVYGDQFDNAQRIQEEGLGLRLHPFTTSAEEFREAFDKLLNNRQIEQRIKNISKQLQAQNSIEEAAKKIEQLAMI